MTDRHDDATADERTGSTGPLPGGNPDDTADRTTPGSDGDGAESSYEDGAGSADDR